MKKAYLSVILLMVLFSCKSSVKTEAQKTAEIIMHEATYVYNDEGGPILVNSDKIEVWVAEKRRVITHFQFTQKDTNDITKMNGKSSYAEIRDSSSEVSMKGDVELFIYENEEVNSIKADELRINTESGEVEGKGNFVLDWGGMSVDGVGIFGNMKKGRFKFDKVNQGYLN